MRSRVLVMVHMKPCSVVFAFDVFDGRRAFLRELVSDYITHLDFNECVWPFWPLHENNWCHTNPLTRRPIYIAFPMFPNHETLTAPTGCLL